MTTLSADELNLLKTPAVGYQVGSAKYEALRQLACKLFGELVGWDSVELTKLELTEEQNSLERVTDEDISA